MDKKEMKSKAAKYGARTVGVGLFAWGALAFQLANNLESKGIGLGAVGLGALIIAPTLPEEWRGLLYAFGAVLILAGLALVAAARVYPLTLGGGVAGLQRSHDQQNQSRPQDQQNQSQQSQQQFLPRARLEVVQYGVYMDGVPEALSPQEAAMILGESLPSGAVVEVDMTSGIVDIWPELQQELIEYGFNPVRTIRKPQDRG